MKTKHTGLKKVKADATPAKPTTTPDVIKSPAQPKELSEQDRDKLGAYLDKSDKPFAVTTVPISRKRKRATETQVQSDLFGDRLTVQYEVKPANNWESLRRYKKFTGGSQSHASNLDDTLTKDQWAPKAFLLVRLFSLNMMIRRTPA